MIRNKILGASIAALLFATGSAVAADLPSVAPYQQPVVAGYDWTGFYVGAQAGYVWEGGNGNTIDGFAGGIHAGYNHQINNWVFGVEADVEYSGADASATIPGVLAVSADVEWLGSVRGRVGYAFDRTLVYATGGVAFGGIEVRATNLAVAPAISASDSKTHVGWTVGAGIEHAITQNVTVRAEYRYTDLGRKTYNFAGIGAARANADDIHAVRVGVSYKF